MKLYANLKYLFIISIIFINISCEDFLDKSPDMGITDDEVFKNYDSVLGLLDRCYNLLDNFHGFDKCRNGRTHIGTISDEFASLWNNAEAIPVNNGYWLASNITNFEIGVDGSRNGTSIWKAYQGLRIANKVISSIDRVHNLTETELNNILGQAYFFRAWFYFQLIKRYGGMPIFDKYYMGDGTEDLPRKTYHESSEWMVADLDKAIDMLPEEWDEKNTGRPTMLAAMAVKSMAQLYDASPLMQNDLNTIEVKDYDANRAKLAAQSAYKVIEYIENNSQTQYKLMGYDEQDLDKKKQIYKNIFYWPAPPYTQPEYIWYNRIQDRQSTFNYDRYLRSFWMPYELTGGNVGNDQIVYNAPTQNMVEMFEKKGVDDLYYPIDDNNAEYDLQSYYENRDPRFYNNILRPGEAWCKDNNGNTVYITTYYEGSMYKTTRDDKTSNKRFQTGYLCKKFMWPECNQWEVGYSINRVITVYIRVAQIYLDFAEAAFEATQNAKAQIEGCGSLTAEQAINKVRNRIGVTNLPDYIVSDPQKFREAYRRERAVELMFENNRWWDIRRWMIAHELFKDQYPIKGINAVPNDYNVPIGEMTFNYSVVDVKPEQRIFEMRNYWYPFSINDVAGLNNLVQNPGW